MNAPTPYQLRKAKEIILVAFYHFGHRLSSHYLERPLHHLYLFLRGSSNTARWVGSHDLCFLEVFCFGNKYYNLLDLDESGAVKKQEAIDRSNISVSEAIGAARELETCGYELIGEVVKKLLRVREYADYKGERGLELEVAASMAYS